MRINALHPRVGQCDCHGRIPLNSRWNQKSPDMMWRMTFSCFPLLADASVSFVTLGVMIDCYSSLNGNTTSGMILLNLPLGWFLTLVLHFSHTGTAIIGVTYHSKSVFDNTVCPEEQLWTSIEIVLIICLRLPHKLHTFVQPLLTGEAGFGSFSRELIMPDTMSYDSATSDEYCWGEEACPHFIYNQLVS
ncbi:hypothetical protein Tco_1228719 [Tanacetum coccineum]